MGAQKMLAILGDSQALILGGYSFPDGKFRSSFPLVKANRVSIGRGLTLVRDLLEDDGSLSVLGKKMMSQVHRYAGEASAYMLSIGSHDIRLQVYKQVHEQEQTIGFVISRIVDYYMQFVAMVQEVVAVPIFICGAVPSPKDFPKSWTPEFANQGSEIEMNIASKIYNDYLRDRCMTLKNVYFVSVFEEGINSFYQTKKDFLYDDVHYGDEAIAKYIIALNNVIKNNNLELPDYFDISQNYKYKKSQTKDIAGTAKIISMSSKYPEANVGLKPVTGQEGYAFHTNEDEAPYILIDIGYAAFVRKIHIFNRFDGFRERADTLEVSVGNDISNMHIIYNHFGRKTFGNDDQPLTIAFEPRIPVFRYIYCRLREKKYFHLGEIQIFAETFL